MQKSFFGLFTTRYFLVHVSPHNDNGAAAGKISLYLQSCYAGGWLRLETTLQELLLVF
jgi:hypothetical protein